MDLNNSIAELEVREENNLFEIMRKKSIDIVTSEVKLEVYP
jgi:hypothetical protein